MPDGEYPFIQARFYTPANRSPEDIMYIVIHDMEVTEDSMTSAEGVGNFFNGPNSSRGSAHYGVDQDSIVQYVEDHDVAWGAPNVNNNGLHFEHAGYARQSRDEWLDEASLNILKRSAVLTRRKADACGIQLKHLSDDELKAGNVKGFIGHADASRVLGGGDHWDPGPDFPWDVYMNLVINGTTTQPSHDDSEEEEDIFMALDPALAAKLAQAQYEAAVTTSVNNLFESARAGDVAEKGPAWWVEKILQGEQTVLGLAVELAK